MRPLAAIGAIVVMAGLLLSTASMSDADRIARYGETPERISLKSLIERGGGGPKNVIITDYMPCENYVVEKQEVTPRSGEYKTRLLCAYVPIVPAEQGLDGQFDRRPRRVHVVVHCTDVKDKDEVVHLCTAPELQGLVEGTLSESDPKTRKLLAEVYPDTEFSKCLMITAGEKVRPLGPPSVVRRIGIWVMYAGCVLLGIAAILWMERAGRAVYYTINTPKNAAPIDASVPPPDPPPPTGTS